MTKLADISRESSSSFNEDPEETRVRKFSKHMLKSTLFIGSFMEKRFVEPLNAYRDVIKIADGETELIDNIIAVRKRCSKFFPKSVWIGITEPKTIGAPAGYNLWVTLAEEVFGSYWYKIKNIEFHHNEVRVKLEIIRPVARETTPVRNISSRDELADISEVGDTMKSCVEDLFTNILTISNVKEAAIFLFLLISTLLTFLIEAIKYLLDYLLKLLRELSGLIKVCSPIIISFMKLIMNTIHGFYALIAVLWRDRSRPKVDQTIYQISPYNMPQMYNNRKALPYHNEHYRGGNYFNQPKSSVTITPLD